ncbi:MAG: hypothetical protein LLG40_11155 [Deltaproteobacteria bacterium]|nr:hypothetical protein [Deltaproteobacteria bacterium]
MLRILNLKRAGYPFQKNDLSPEEWADLGQMVESNENISRQQATPVYLVKIL